MFFTSWNSTKNLIFEPGFNNGTAKQNALILRPFLYGELHILRAPAEPLPISKSSAFESEREHERSNQLL